VDALGDAQSRKLADMDAKASTSIKSGSYVYLKADLDALIRAVGNAQADQPIEPVWIPWFAASRANNAGTVPDNTTGPTYLTGGADGTPTGTTWQNALDATLDLDVNQGWAETIDSEVTAKIAAHLQFQRGQGGRPFRWQFATARTPSKATAKAAVLALNREDAQVWPNATRFLDELGKARWFDPLYTALRAAAAYCGTSVVGMPLMRKTFDVLDIEHGSDWTERRDGEELLRAGLCLLARNKLGTGFWCVRDLTTYRQAPDAILTAPSAVESMDASRIDLDRFLDYVVGQPNFDNTAVGIRDAAKARLKRQVSEFRYLKSASDLSVEVLGGSTLRVNVSGEPVMPITWVNMKWTYAIPVSLQI
jgi:hypothetical protein